MISSTDAHKNGSPVSQSSFSAPFLEKIADIFFNIKTYKPLGYYNEALFLKSVLGILQ